MILLHLLLSPSSKHVASCTRKALKEANNLEIHLSVQDLPSSHDYSEVWSPLSDLSQSSRNCRRSSCKFEKLNHNSSDYDSDDASEDTCDVTYIAITDKF
ncbi:hypothetical protein AOLI_G00126130 [Acnodon oligacanthus]